MGYRTFVEVSPDPVLRGLAAQRLPTDSVAWLPSLRRGHNDWQELLDSLSQLFVKGARIDWAGYDLPYGRRRLSLPGYPFQRERFWPKLPVSKPKIQRIGKPIHPLLGYRLLSALPDLQFETSLSGDDFGFVNDHQVSGMTLLPATAFIEMASAGGKAVFGTEAVSLEDFVIHRPLIFDRGKARVVQTIISPCPEGDYGFKICSRAHVEGQSAELAFSGETMWTVHVTGRIQKAGGKVDGESASRFNPHRRLLDRCSEEISGRAHYEELARRGFRFGPALQGVSFIRRGRQEALGRIRQPGAPGQVQAAFGFHPALLDACLQFFWSILPEDSKTESYLPMSFERFRVHSAPGTEIWSYISKRPAANGDAGKVEGDVRIYDSSGKLVAALDKLSFRKADRSALLESRLPGIRDWFYRLEWEPTAGSALLQPDSGGDTTGAGRFIPPLDQIAAHVAHSMSILCETDDLVAHHRFFCEIEALSCVYAAEALETLGLAYHPGRRFSEEGFFQDAKIDRRYRRLLHRLLQILAEEGMLRQVEGGYEIVHKRSGEDSRTRLEKLLSRPKAKSSAQLELVNRCGQKLAQALTGKADPLALLFPNGSLTLAARLYSESPEARVFNSLVREAVGKALVALPPGRKARILELGAGTGGATSFVLPGLQPDRTEYVFTDISPVFLKQASERFKAYPFVTYRLCNIERGPEEQSFDPNTFDIVIGMNMLHATRDLKQSLTNVYKFLTPGGILILLEGTAPERWIDVTFGLTDGWWAFTDVGLRPDYPLLPRETWCTVLGETGFTEALTTPEPTGLSTEALIIARKPFSDVEKAGQNRSDTDRWLVLMDTLDIGRRLADSLESLGFDCLRVSPGKRFEKKGSHEWSIRFDQPEDFQRLFVDVGSEEGRNPGHIVHLSSINAEINDDAGVAAMERSQTFVSRSLLFLLQAMLKRSNGHLMPDLAIVTCGAQPVDSTHAVAVAQAPAWGVSKALGLEHPDLAWRCIDLDPGASSGQNVRHLIAELTASNPENMIAFRAGQTWVPRLKRAGDLMAPNRETAAPEDSTSLRLEKSKNGILEELTLAPSEYKEPGPGTVQIRVHAAGLSFRDVMNALSMRDDPEPLGSECSGRITKVGKGVRGFSIGDAVIALASGSMGTTVNAQAEFVLPKPESLSFKEAATLPTAFLTAHYALNHLGKIRKGEKVLIHAAAGGVGMAAVQLALAAEAEVFGTAGSEAKRDHLRSLGLKLVMDSRTTAFAEEIMAVTDGRGVDVVLNSLSGNFITQSFSALAANGRFLEIGKRDILTSAEAQRLRPDVVYHVVDLAATSYENPPLIRKLFEQVMSLVEHGKIKPLPLRVFPLTEAEVAFRYMSQSKHIGKVVIKNERSRDDAPIICSDATYLVTGGLSGLGLVVGEWLAEKGAKHLALMARSAVGQAVLEKIVALEQKGVSVRTFQADVSVTEQVDRCLREIADRMPPLRGIIHSAGVLADSVLLNQTWDQYDAVYRPKIYGAWNLHRLTKALDLDFFVLFSSAAGLFGSAGQSNHSAANAFLDALAHYRRQQGLPALSINWGVWAEIGAAARRKADERMVFQGIGAIPPQLGIKALETVLPSKAAQIAVVPVDWEVMLEKYGGAHTPPWLSEMRSPKYVFEHAPAVVLDAASAAASSVLAELERLPTGKRHKALLTVVQDYTAKVIGVRNASEIDPARPLSEQGVDSLMAVELRNLLGKGLGMQKALPATIIFDYPTIEALTDFLLRQYSLTDSKAGKELSGQTKKTDDMIDAIQKLSDDEVDRMLG